MLVYGLIWFFSGFPLVFMSRSSLTTIINFHIWAWVFVIGGAVAIGSALRGTPHADRLGFTALFLTGMLWVVRCFVLWGLWHLTADPRIGLPHGWEVGVVNGLLVFKVYIDVGWSENVTPLRWERATHEKREGRDE